MNLEQFNYLNNNLHIEDVDLVDLASNIETPFYVYSSKTIKDNCKSYLKNLSTNDLVCYAVKANSNLSILSLIKDEGLGFDVVSGGELKRVLQIGADPRRIVFSGVGKSKSELILACEANIFSINVESEYELNILEEINKKPRISFRINPDIAAESHPYIETGKADCKFGISEDEALLLAKKYSPDNLNLVGVSAHIGSQITNTELLIDSYIKLENLADQLCSMGYQIDHIDIGGGLAVDYELEKTFEPEELIKRIKSVSSKYNLTLEPGRSIVAQSGALVTKVLGIKENGSQRFVIADAGMNDLMRPSLYKARHKIENLVNSQTKKELYSVVGPVCETADSFGSDFEINAKAGDYLAIYSSGAYGSSMGSNYNSRLKPAEILIEGSHHKVIRKLESFKDLIKEEEI
jgi:diaminopimelate decarboxylase